jgi:hypothetical protein
MMRMGLNDQRDKYRFLCVKESAQCIGNAQGFALLAFNWLLL